MEGILMMIATGWGFDLVTVKRAYLKSSTKSIDEVVDICEKETGSRAG